MALNGMRFGTAKLAIGEWNDAAWGRAASRLASDVLEWSSAGTRECNADGAVPPPSVAHASADFPAVFSLANLDGINGFRLEGSSRGDNSGSVSSAGDVNGDGFDDVIIGADGVGKYVGASYVVFGKAGGFDPSVEVGALDGGDGFRIDGIEAYDNNGRSVSSAGDVNGDGFGDIIIGTFRAGQAYVVFGKGAPFDATFDLATLDGTNGFRMDNVRLFDEVGKSVSDAGDVNGDGVDDIIIGAPQTSASGRYSAGASYVVFGHADAFSATVDLASLDGTNGFRVIGVDRKDQAGLRVSSAGDVNGDGFDDILIGNGPDTYNKPDISESYIVFGKADGFDPTVDLATLDGTNGFRMVGEEEDDAFGAGSSAGDVNGDGYADVVLGASRTGDFQGRSYVVFGRASGFVASLAIATLDGTDGFAINGINPGDHFGGSISSAGDVNGDGFDDILIGAAAANESYLIFGHAGGFDAILDPATLDGTNGMRIEGVHRGDGSGAVSSAGDVNGDGFDDIIIGARYADPNGKDSGESYVLFGRAPTEAVTRIGSAADQTIRGGNFDDTLRGKQGDDVLAGAGGHDRLAGGAGADDFALASRSAADADTILDFGRGADCIALDGGVFGLAEGALVPGRFVIGGAAGDANDRLIYDDATGELFFDADGTGAQAQVLIATLTGAPSLTAADVMVI